MPTIDIDARSNQSFVDIIPCSEAGEAWMRTNCGEAHAKPDQWPRYAVENRYGPDILMAAHRDGLTVALDGRVADAERN